MVMLSKKIPAALKEHCDRAGLRSDTAQKVSEKISSMGAPADDPSVVPQLVAAAMLREGASDLLAAASEVGRETERKCGSLILDTKNLVGEAISGLITSVSNVKTTTEKVTDRAVSEVTKRTSAVATEVIGQVEKVINVKIDNAISVIKRELKSGSDQSLDELRGVTKTVSNDIKKSVKMYLTVRKVTSSAILAMFMFFFFMLVVSITTYVVSDYDENRLVESGTVLGKLSASDVTNIAFLLMNDNDIGTSIANGCSSEVRGENLRGFNSKYFICTVDFFVKRVPPTGAVNVRYFLSGLADRMFKFAYNWFALFALVLSVGFFGYLSGVSVREENDKKAL